MIARLGAACATLVLTAAGCGGEDDPTASEPVPAPTPAPPVSGAHAFIGSIAVDPQDGTVMLGTGLGLFRMESGATSAHRGQIQVSADGGETWERAGSVGLTVNELAVDADGTLYAAVAGGELQRSTDGGKHWARLGKLE